MWLVENDGKASLERRVKQAADAGHVLYIIKMDAGENRFTLDMNAQLHHCLDRLEADLPLHPPAWTAALLIIGSGKYFSLGLDLASYHQGEGGQSPQTLFHQTYQRLLARLLVLPLITVAALNGHAIAGGMVLALVCDYRVMRGRRGFMAMNEINLPSSVPAGMLAVVRAKMGADPALLRECLLRGQQYTSAQMHAHGVVDVLVEDDGEDAVLTAGMEMAERCAHPLRKTPFLGLIKQLLYREALAPLTELETFDHFQFALRTNSSSKL